MTSQKKVGKPGKVGRLSTTPSFPRPTAAGPKSPRKAPNRAATSRRARSAELEAQRDCESSLYGIDHND